MQPAQEIVVYTVGRPVLWLPVVICLVCDKFYPCLELRIDQNSWLVSCIYAVTLHPLASYKGPLCGAQPRYHMHTRY